MSNNNQEYEKDMEAYHDACQRANEIKLGTYHVIMETGY